MNILVINGSPKNERSDTLQLTRAFLEGMGETAEILHTMQANVRPCLGCFSCWFKTPGQCIQKDDMSGIIERYLAADLVIWSLPLYCYGAPSQCKAVIDRLLPLNSPEMYADQNGHTHHPCSRKLNMKSLLISGCGFPDLENNFEGLRFQFKRMFGEMPMIFCTEAPLMGIAEAAPVARVRLELFRKAGREYKETGGLSAPMQAALDAPMIPPEQYRAASSKK